MLAFGVVTRSLTLPASDFDALDEVDNALGRLVGMM